MSEAREALFEQLGRSLGRGAGGATSTTSLEPPSATRPTHVRPAVGSDLAAQFTEKFQARSGTVATLAELGGLPAAVEAYLAEFDLPARIVIGAELEFLAWPARVEHRTGPARRDDLVGVSACLLGIAETGRLLFCSGPATPTTHNFVPDHQIVLLRRAEIVAHLEDAWARLRRLSGGMARAVNLVSGPSRTADIEQTIQLGAHGPRRVHVLLL